MTSFTRSLAKSEMRRLDDGVPSPLGATFDGRGVNFALYSENATGVDLCLFDPAGREEVARFAFPRRTEGVWHLRVDGLKPGQLYGYRVHGPYEPTLGHRFNPAKLLIDPYARQLVGPLKWHRSLFGHPGRELPDPQDTAPFVPKSMVARPNAVTPDSRPRRPWTDTVIYEAHVKGLTRLHPDVPQQIRGTYDALGHPRVVEHLRRIGVTAVELLPIQSFVDDKFLVDKGLHNYWGYSSLAYFAPEPRYFSRSGVEGLHGAIAALHAAGIEVILDVVFNHTAEGDENGPTLSLRGVDNAVYYRLSAENPARYVNATGTGNTINAAHPQVVRLVMDALRHWVETYQIDGFRFDLGTVLARDPIDFDPNAGFLAAAAQDPVLRDTKLIAEPWDVGHGGYRLGGFPRGWSEWNDVYRDTVRRFWRGEQAQLPALSRAITGSQEVFQGSGRHPWASINYVTSHDGFTLHDLSAYEHRHNGANGEENRDGHHNNLSLNHGVEGETDDLTVIALRAQYRRNLMATLFLSLGTPMVLAGDELSRSQGGNNNAYCQDNETSWVDWQPNTIDPEFLAFVEALTEIRRSHPALRRYDYFDGIPDAETGLGDTYWLAPEGREMTMDDWAADRRRTIGFQFGNDSGPDARLLLIFNGADEAVEFRLPDDFNGEKWRLVFDSRRADGRADPLAPGLAAGGSMPVPARSVQLLKHVAKRTRSGRA